VPLLPSVPYSPELECVISRLYGLSLDEIIPEIFEKNEKPSLSKCAFWEAVACVYERAFAMQMEEACEKYGKALTGHVISEESPFRNAIFHSNPFRVLKHFHLPGVDLLSNKTDNIDVFAHKLPFSCAFLKGKTGFMSETSDFAEQRFDGKKPVSPQTMAAALLKQYLLGVREFSYYYDFRARSVEDYREANNIIRRACEYGKSFEFNPEIAVYCPYETFWSGYFPTSLELNDILGEQASYIKDAEADITALCSELFNRNVQFVLVDESSVHELIERGVKSVVIPKCKVVSKDLEEAALEGKLELYGFQPNYVYEKGSLRKPDKHLVIRDNCLIKGRHVPFSFSGRILFSAFKDGRYYLFNDNSSDAYIVADIVLETYNPYTNKTEVREKGGQISILPGQGIFLARWITFSL
jgi:hypothetical protein